MLLLDFETRSRCDLIKRGTYNYAQDPSTDIICCGFTFTDIDDTREWLWWPSEPLPDEVREYLENTNGLVGAHNAAFDRLIYECVGPLYELPVVGFDRWYCTSAQMRVNNLPASLEDAARSLNAAHKKDHKGSALIRKHCIPQKDGTFNTDAKGIKDVGAYCLQDIRTTKSIVNMTRLMTAREHEDWLINEDINERGVMIDVKLAEAAQLYANDEFIELSTWLSKTTHGAITKHTQSARAAAWVVAELGPDDPLSLWFTKEVGGVTKVSIDKNIREEVIEAYENNDIDMPDKIMDVVYALDEGSKSSVTKFKNMALRADIDTHRINGAFVYAGASQSLRYASRGLQMHNMPSRGLFKSIEQAWAVYDQMIARREFNMPVMETLKKMLRHAVMPAKGNVFVIGDWKGIEARVLPWLSNSGGGDTKLDRIENGADVYMDTAKEIGLPDRRDVGKVMELACGYEGGVAAFKQFAKGYGVSGFDNNHIGVLIKKWRRANTWVVEFWRGLEKAAIRAMREPNKFFNHGRVRYFFSSTLIEGSLLCILPDDTVLTYPKARLERSNGRTKITALKSSIKMKADAKEWPRESLYGGKLAGHVTQGTAAALLRNLLITLDDVVAHVHDEVILEVSEDEAQSVKTMLADAMRKPPAWAHGLPLDAEPEIAERYKK